MMLLPPRHAVAARVKSVRWTRLGHGLETITASTPRGLIATYADKGYTLRCTVWSLLQLAVMPRIIAWANASSQHTRSPFSV